MMKKLNMQTTNIVDENIKRIGELFPNCLTERLNDEGKPEVAIDFDQLRQELSKDIVEGAEERYQFTWPDKRNAIRLANAPTTDTLRPVREDETTPTGADSTGKPYCSSGSVDFDNTQNLYIEGDNLQVLKLLRENYLGKVKMIYIDPPYNTGNDFVYNDDFSLSAGEYMHNSGQEDEEGNRLVVNTESNGRFHTDWLNMIYPRLKVAKDLLSEDGVIFISIDDCELKNLENVCNEIFGESNFVANMIWQSTAGSNTGTDIVTVTENILVYTKCRNRFEFDGKLTDDNSFSFVDEYVKERGKYAIDKMDRRRVAGHYSEALNFPIEMPDGTLRWPGGTTERNSEGWNYLWSKTKVQWGLENGFIVFKKSGTEWNVYNKRYAKVDNEGKPSERSIPFRNLITSDQSNTAQGTAEQRILFEFRPFDFPKPTSLLSQLLLTAVRRSENSIILDFFSGSATTAHAVMQLNAEDGGKRKFIMVQLPEETAEDSEAYKAGYKNICEIGKERIRRAGKKIKEESPLTTQDLDTGFRVLKLDSSNMQDVYYTPSEFNEQKLFDDNIKPDRTEEDLLFQTMIELGIELSAKIEKRSIAGKAVWSVSDGYLMACFDEEVNETTITEIARQHPYYFVMRDSSLANDQVADNFEQIWEEYSKDTVRRIL